MLRGLAGRVAMAALAAVAFWLAYAMATAVVPPPRTAPASAGDPRNPGWAPRPGEYRGPSVPEMIEQARRDGEVMPDDVIE